MCLWESLHVDAGQHDVVQDVDPVDLVQLSDAVLELKQRDVVHRDPERLVSAQDLHLEHRGHTCDVYEHIQKENNTFMSFCELRSSHSVILDSQPKEGSK